jgi:hypothetical protein
MLNNSSNSRLGICAVGYNLTLYERPLELLLNLLRIRRAKTFVCLVLGTHGIETCFKQNL